MLAEIGSSIEDERNKEGLRDCLFPQYYYANLEHRPLMRRTECEVRRDSCDIVSFKTARRRVVHTSSHVMCDSCERSVSSVQGCLFSDLCQSQSKREQFICAGCLMMIGIERWELHEWNKPGQLRKDCSVCNKRIAEKGNKPRGKRVETTGAAQGVMVETLEYDDGMLIESRFGFVSELTTRGATPPLFPISGSSIEQLGYKKEHWTERRLSTLAESSRLFLVLSVLILKMHGTSVAFTCSGDYDPNRQPKPLLQSLGVSLLNDQMRSGTRWVQANWQVTVEGKSSVNKLAGVFLFTDHNSARGWSCVTNRRGTTKYRLHRGRQDSEGVRVR